MPNFNTNFIDLSPSDHDKLHFKISHKLCLSFSILILVFLSSFWLVSKNEIRKMIQIQTDGFGQTVTNQAAVSVRELILSNDILSLNVVLNQFVEEEYILNVAVYDIDGVEIASSGTRAGIEADTAYIESIYQADISLQGSIAGTVQLAIDNIIILNNINKIQNIFWTFLIVGLFSSIILAYFVSKHFSLPILAVANAMYEPSENSLEPQVNRTDEIALLELSYLDLIEEYSQGTNNTQNYPAVNTFAKQEINTATKIMTSTLVIKVVNMNTAIELLHPSTLSELISEYLSFLKQAAQLYGAHVHQINGESAMLVFIDDFKQDQELEKAQVNHSVKAICCALLFVDIMDKIKQSHKANASQALTFKLAIHSGDIFYSTNANDSNNNNDTFLMGKTIETSYFLAQHSQPGEVLISDSCYSLADGQNNVIIEEQKEITLPADNMSFMAYIIAKQVPEYHDQIEQQSMQILS